MTKTPPTMAPAPASLAAALASAGLDVELSVTRTDGSPLTDDDRAAVEALVACHDLEAGRAVDDDTATSAAAAALGIERPAPGEPLAKAS